VERRRVVIVGAAGRDFHNFNVLFRDSDAHEVVAFTATQIPNIDGRTYPSELAGDRYPRGIPIRAEDELEQLIRSDGVDEIVFSYSDVSHEHVMHVASRALAAGADFRLVAPCVTELDSSKPCVAIGAVRTGAGKSQTGRRVTSILRAAGQRVAVLRHPMPYGDLTKQAVQRFATYADLEAADCTIEEREEYEPHIDEGNVVYAGVDYGRILAQAELEANVIVWEGGNNDTPFVRPDLLLVIVDPHRPGHELRFHPGETNLRMADVCIVNKIDSASPEAVDEVLASIAAVNPTATVVRAASPIEVEGDASLISGKRVLCVEDGPTLTHGDMAYGAAVIAARQHGAAEIVDPRPFAVGSIAETFEKYPGTGPVLPAMGYGDEQIAELAETIARSDADVVLIGTPIDLRRLIEIDRPAFRVRYRLEEIGDPTLESIFAERGLLSHQPVG
jgi:predicted GTPase